MGVTFKEKLLKEGQCVNCCDENLRVETACATLYTDPKQSTKNASQSASTKAWTAQNQIAILAYNDMVLERGVFSDGVRSF